MKWRIKMEDKRILELEKKIQELEKLRDQCSLTNDIKQLLDKCIQSYDNYKKETKELSNNLKIEGSCEDKICIKYKSIFLIMLAIIVGLIIFAVLKES